MTESVTFQKNDLVWAKMKGFSPWPGMIVDPPSHMLQTRHKRNVPSQCVFFFGTRNYAWIEDVNIKPYMVYRDDLTKTSKSNVFREAVEEIEAYIKDPTTLGELDRPGETAAAAATTTTDNDDEFNKLRSEESSSEKTPPAKKTPKLKAKSVSGKSSSKISATTTSGKRKRESVNETRKKIINAEIMTPSTSRRSTHATLLNRPTIERPEVPDVDLSKFSESVKGKNIKPSKLRFGFLGLGIMGGTIVKNFMFSGHKVVIWNRTATKCETFVAAGAEVKQTPSEVIDSADVTFCCVADPRAAKDLVFGNCGVLQASTLREGKGYIEMSTIDPETSQDIAEGIISAGGRYLEAQLQGSRPEAEAGSLVILAAGDRSLFTECQSCFESIGRNSFFLGDAGNACKVNLILQTIVGVSLVGLSEAMALADRFSISLKDILEIIELTAIKSGLVLEKGKEMLCGEFTPQHPLAHMQKDLRLVLGMAESLDQSMPTTAISNEVFKHAKRLGYSEHDSSAVYVRARF